MTDQTNAAAPGAGTPTPTAAAPAAPMKFKMRTTLGFDNGPAFGISTKSKVFEIEGSSMQEIMQKALQIYVENFGQEPKNFASFQLTLALDTSDKKGDNTKA